MNSKAQKKFLKKVVNVVDDMLYEKGLGEVVTIDWNKKELEVSLEHDEYGYIGLWGTKASCKLYLQNKKKNVNIKKSDFIRVGIGASIVRAVENFVNEHKYDDDDWSYGCDDFNDNKFNYDFNDEEDDDFDIGTIEEDFEDEESIDDVKLDDEFEELGNEEEVVPKMTPVFEDDTITCPNCKSRDIKKNGKKNGIQRYVCKHCNKYFSDTTLKL